LTAGLAAEHRELDSHWRRVRSALALVAAGTSTALVGDDIGAFVGLYRRHVAREESELLPMAARLLGDEVLDRVGRAMRERRGIAQV
jgi:hemerythrin-like domain-containing protein